MCVCGGCSFVERFERVMSTGEWGGVGSLYMYVVFRLSEWALDGWIDR